jgi:hypothetical protein
MQIAYAATRAALKRLPPSNPERWIGPLRQARHSSVEALGRQDLVEMDIEALLLLLKFVAESSQVQTRVTNSLTIAPGSIQIPHNTGISNPTDAPRHEKHKTADHGVTANVDGTIK